MWGAHGWKRDAVFWEEGHVGRQSPRAGAAPASQTWGELSLSDLGLPLWSGRVGGLSSHPPSMPVCILPLLGVPDLEAD